MSEDLHLLGRLAVHYKLLTAEQLAETTRTQARTSDPRPLGELWIDAGWMTRAQLDKLLAVQREVVAKQLGQVAAPLIPKRLRASAVDLEQTATGEISTRAGRRIDRILEYAVSQRASDVHIVTGERVLLRRDGQLTFAGDAPLEHGQIERLVAEVLDPRLREQLDRRRSDRLLVDDRRPGALPRQRLPAPTRPGDSCCAPSPLEIRHPARASACPTPSPSSPTITRGWCCSPARPVAASRRRSRRFVRLINEERQDHIVTVEDPIEIPASRRNAASSTSARSGATPTASPARCAARCARIRTSS